MHHHPSESAVSRGIVFLLFLTLAVPSCSSGFHCPQQAGAPRTAAPAAASRPGPAAPRQPQDGECDRGDVFAANRKNTIFAHPGMIFLFDWGGGRAEDATQVLVDRGCGREFLLVSDRGGKPLYRRLAEETGTNYLGLHYSLGASPHVVASALRSVAQASRDTNRDIVYNAILVEPHGFEKFETEVDLSSPHLGVVVAIVSSEYSFLRPNMHRLPKSLYENEKVIIVYAEDFQASWGHFGFLGSVRSRKPSHAARDDQAKNIFVALAEDIVGGQTPACIRAHIEGLKTSLARSGTERPESAGTN
jgi:hypothetical protein